MKNCKLKYSWNDVCCGLALFFFCSTSVLHAQTVETYTVNGSWVCPGGVTSVQVEAWGGGAGGRSVAAVKGRAGGGGGGGAYTIRNSITVVPGTSYSFTVGSGGVAATGSASTAGEATSATINGVSIIAAGGGSPGGESSTTGASTGGIGGGASGSVGDLVSAGGNGGFNFSNSSQSGDGHGGGGGGGAGTTSAGSNGGDGSSSNAGSGGSGGASDGGAGGNGGNNVGSSASTIGYGGGGGGAGHKSTGGNGQNGAIRFTYTCPLGTADAGSDQSICEATTIMNATVPTAGTGTWTVQSGTATITTLNSPSTSLSNVGVGANVLRWTVSNGNCGSSYDEVTVVRNTLCNDDCSDAVALTIDAAVTTGTTSGATTESGETGPCGGALSRSVWYKFTATSAEHTVNLSRSVVSTSKFYTAVYKGNCGVRTQVSCIDGNFSTGTTQKHHLKQLTVGVDYLIQVTSDANAQAFNVDVDSGAEYGNDGCNCHEVNPIVEPGSCFTDDLGGTVSCLASGCQTGSNSTTIYTIIPTGNTLDVSVDNLSTSFIGNVEVRLYSGTCSLGYLASACGSAPFHYQFSGLTAGTQYKIFVSSSTSDNESSDIYGICVSDDGSACGVTSGCGEVPPPGDPIMRLELAGQGYATETVVRFKNGATSNYDVAYDALYFPANDPNGIEFATMSADGEDLVINSLDVNSMTQIVELYSETNTSGNYTIEMTEMTDFSAGYSVVLKDNQLGVTHLLNDGVYSFSGSGSDATDRFEITAFPVTTPQIITSVADGQFGNAGTWDCNCVPQFTDDIRIAHDITLATDFSIGASGTLRVNSGNVLTVQVGNTLAVQGTINNSGQIVGEVTANGYGSQTIDGGLVDNLNVNNSNGVDLGGELKVKSRITLTSGVVNTAGNNLILVSDASESAIMIHDGGSINGDITVEQYIPSDNGHHYLASPLTNTVVGDYSDDWNLNLSGANPLLYYYDESSTAWSVPANESETVPNGKGYTGWINAGTTVDLVGEVNTGETTVDVTNGGTIESGWNFIGNPYPSSIDWNLVDISSEVSGAIYVWDHDQTSWGAYATYFDGVSTNGGTSIIPRMQGFFVYASGNGTVSFSNDDRVAVSGQFLRITKSSDDPLLRFQLSGDAISTETVIRLRDNAVYAYHTSEDALYFPAGNESGIEFASVSSDGRNLVVNTVPELNSQVAIPLFTSFRHEGVYEIALSEEINFVESVTLQLYDHKLGVTHILNDGAYAFVGTPDDDENRFQINVAMEALGTDEVAVRNIAVHAFGYCTNESLNIKFNKDLQKETKLSIYNCLGQKLYESYINQGSSHYVVNRAILGDSTVYLAAIDGVEEVVKVVLID